MKMRHHKRTSLPTLLMAVLLAACATSPTGRRQLMLVSEVTAIQSLAQAYVQQVGQLRKEGKLSGDRALVVLAAAWLGRTRLIDNLEFTL